MLADRLYVTKQAVSKWETGKGLPDTTILPTVSKELEISIDELMGEQPQIKRKKWWILPLILVLDLMLLTIIPIINAIQERNAYDEYALKLESILEINLPVRGRFVSESFPEWTAYGNLFEIQQMSYFVFSDTSERDNFEHILFSSTEWRQYFSDEEKELIPLGLQNYLLVGNYFFVWNASQDEPFVSCDINLSCQYLFMIYQSEYHRLIVFEYTQ